MNDTKCQFLNYMRRYSLLCTFMTSLTWILAIVLIVLRGDSINWLWAISMFPVLFGVFGVLIFIPAAYLDARNIGDGE